MSPLIRQVWEHFEVSMMKKPSAEFVVSGRERLTSTHGELRNVKKLPSCSVKTLISS